MKRLLSIVIILINCVFANAKTTHGFNYSISNTILAQALTPPQYIGGEKEFSKFLNENLQWPKTDKDVQGIVIISFMVEKNGSLSSFKVEKSFRKEFDEEALRVMMKSPKWIPAGKYGKPIKSKYSVPIKFFLTS